jgi:hypothetical protein
MYPISTKVDGFSETERLWDSGFEAGLSHHEPISKASQAALETSRASVAIDGWRSALRLSNLSSPVNGGLNAGGSFENFRSSFSFGISLPPPSLDMPHTQNF